MRETQKGIAAMPLWSGVLLRRLLQSFETELDPVCFHDQVPRICLTNSTLVRLQQQNTTPLNMGTAAIPLLCLSHETYTTRFTPFCVFLMRHTLPALSKWWIVLHSTLTSTGGNETITRNSHTCCSHDTLIREAICHFMRLVYHAQSSKRGRYSAAQAQRTPRTPPVWIVCQQKAWIALPQQQQKHNWL